MNNQVTPPSSPKKQKRAKDITPAFERHTKDNRELKEIKKEQKQARNFARKLKFNVS